MDCGYDDVEACRLVSRFILLRFIATNKQKHKITKDKQNDKQLELPDSSRLVVVY